MNEELVRPQDILEAAERIRGKIHRTPVLRSRRFNEAASVEAYFKCEPFQRGGSFKIRGATNFVSLTPGDQLKRGLVTYSSGNHAQAVAIAARDAGVKATIVMPKNAPSVKIEAVRSYGAEILLYDPEREQREEVGHRLARERNAILIPPFDHPYIIAGQGTVALELLEDVPDLDVLVGPVGGGGLMAGCSIIAHAKRPALKIFGVEPELANDTYLSLKEGKRVSIGKTNTIADGLRVNPPGELTFPILQRHLEDVLLVSEEEILETLAFLLTRLKVVVEPSGAVAAAAVLHQKLPGQFRRVGIILSGGNLDLGLLAETQRIPSR